MCWSTCILDVPDPPPLNWVQEEPPSEDLNMSISPAYKTWGFVGSTAKLILYPACPFASPNGLPLASAGTVNSDQVAPPSVDFAIHWATFSALFEIKA